MRSNQRKPTRIPDQYADHTLVAWLPDGRMVLLRPEMGLRNFYAVVDVVETVKAVEKLAKEYGLTLVEPLSPIFTQQIEDPEQSQETTNPPPFVERLADEIHAYVMANSDIRLVDLARGLEGGKYSYQVIARAVRLLQVQSRIKHYRVGRHKYLTTDMSKAAPLADPEIEDFAPTPHPSNGKRRDQEVDLRSPTERAKRFAALLKQKDEDGDNPTS